MLDSFEAADAELALPLECTCATKVAQLIFDGAAHPLAGIAAM